MTVEMKPCEASPDCLHVPCEHCGAGIRVGGSIAKDHPGTRKGTLASGQCGSCNKRGGPPVPTVPDRCVNCDMPFRGRSELLEDRPGTVRHEGLGQCVSCYREKRLEERAAYDREVNRLKRKKQFEASEEEMRDERHVLLSDKVLRSMRDLNPHMYWWHVGRRKRLGLESLRDEYVNSVRARRLTQ